MPMMTEDQETRTDLTPLEMLAELREYAGPRQTAGLSDAMISTFLHHSPVLADAIHQAWALHRQLRQQDELSAVLSLGESQMSKALQADYVNFYPPATVNPYVALAAAGPWIVTAHGAVLHDNGGYGMLGMGHAPEPVLAAMRAPWVMANIMTPSFSHLRLTQTLGREIGHARAEEAPTFSRFLCMNSGSEAVTVAARISDVNVLRMTEPGGRHEGKAVYFLGLEGGFHGRTDRPAQFSDSSLPKYRKHLASFKERSNLFTVPPNDIDALKAIFQKANDESFFIEAMFMEPVMGEGRPGRAIRREFYDVARALTLAHGAMLVIDSVQAGLRATGCLSIIDYPGFEDCVPPDMEVYSKALNAGQYPLSVLAMTDRAANLYAKGIYGNTMTANPRALEVACAVLDGVTPALRHNIRDRGREFVDKLTALAADFPALIVSVEGTGLLFCAELRPDVPVIGFDGVETWCRKHGLGVIHGGHNALRFTPHFAITTEEVDLVIGLIRQALEAFSVSGADGSGSGAGAL
ncbi:MAG: aminotransferase class III-fold pyridoxal phosphate-dependent enzyme [Myxococcota bacterium]